eukprot:gene12978-17403_t
MLTTIFSYRKLLIKVRRSPLSCIYSHLSNIQKNNSSDHEHFEIQNADYSYHLPVMKKECCDYLNIKSGGIYVDCTLGGGGHTRAILERGGFVVGLDQDPDAIKTTSDALRVYINNNSFEIIPTNFRDIEFALKDSKLAKNGKVDGVLMDLGVSSFQINEPNRGFAFGQDGPLDMRMNKGLPNSTNDIFDSKELTASIILNTWDVEEIADILYKYGDEVRSRQIAREIVANRPLNSTLQLSNTISRITSFKQRAKTLARCFQALRIVVNDELGSLNQALKNMHHLIKPNGRLVILSYHSLEDRIVKNLLKQSPSVAESSKVNNDNNYINNNDNNNNDNDNCYVWKPLFKRAMVPSDEEIKINRRARSAKLRVAEVFDLNKKIDDNNGNEIDIKKSILRKNRMPKLGAKELAKLAKEMDNNNQLFEN